MSILITGSNGFIGSNLLKKVINKNKEVVSIDSRDSDTGYEYFKIDLLKDVIPEKLQKPYEVIFHCAGDSDVQKSVRNPIENFNNQALMTLKMLEFARKTKSNCFILLSSVSIFDADNELPLTEKSRIKPTSPYGAAKLAAEGYCYAYHRTYGLDIRIARIFNTYGPGCNHLFIYDMLNKIKNADKEILMKGTGNQIRDYIYIDDLVEALCVIWKNGEAGEDYNVCSGNPVKLLDIIKILKKYLGKDNIVIKADGVKQTGDIEKWYGDIKKLQAIGFVSKTDIESGLKLLAKTKM